MYDYSNCMPNLVYILYACYLCIRSALHAPVYVYLRVMIYVRIYVPYTLHYLYMA